MIFNIQGTGLENGTLMENVIIQSLSNNKTLCKISVPPQVAVIKLGTPDILVCGHLDGFITTVHFKYTSSLDCPSSSHTPTSSQIQAFDYLNYTRKSFRGHTSAVISLEVNKVMQFKKKTK